MSYNERLQQNNTELNNILSDINSLPNASTPNPPAVYQNLKVTENGTYTAGAGYDAIGQVEVEVAGSSEGDGNIETCTLTISTNVFKTCEFVCTEVVGDQIVTEGKNTIQSQGSSVTKTVVKNSLVYINTILEDSSSLGIDDILVEYLLEGETAHFIIKMSRDVDITLNGRTNERPD